jgi:hypothetical protein
VLQAKKRIPTPFVVFSFKLAFESYEEFASSSLRMWSIRKMKLVTFTHNDDVKCLHIVVQRTHKLVMMGRINFEDHALIRRWWVDEKMNATSGMFKNMKKWGNHWKRFVFVARSCVHF